MPGAVPRTSTEALTSATLPYVLRLAERGLDALREDEALAAGASTVRGKLVCGPVAEAQGIAWTPLEQAMA
jgi:alanine dehydrogenase